MKQLMLIPLALAAPFAYAQHAIQIQAADAAALRQALGASEQINYAAQYQSFSVLRISDQAIAAARAAGVRYEDLSDNDRIRFGTVDLDPIASNASSANLAVAGLKLVQFQSQLKSEWLDALKLRSIDVLQSYPGNSVLVWSHANALVGLEKMEMIRWVGDFAPAFKIDHTLNPQLKERSGLIENVIAQVYAADLAQTLAQLSAAGAQIISYAPAQPDRKLYDVVFKARDSELPSLAQISKVIMLSYSSPRGYFDDEMSGQILAGNIAASGTTVTGPGYLSFLNTLGLTGVNVTWAVTDSGVDLTHPEFSGRIAGGYSYPGCPAGTGLGDDNSGGGHGTHVAGIIAGAGVLGTLDAASFNYGIGVAPQSKIFAQNPICVGSVPWPPAGGWQETSKRALLGGAIGTNNSWTSGEGTNAGYTNGARSHDLMVRDGNFDTATVNEPFMIVFSAGNSGPNANTLTSPKEAKNAIIVAASRNQRVGSIGDIASFSSRGPAVDGRLLPTITTPGEQIASTRRVAGGVNCATAIAGTSNNFSFCSGTSMAAPHASGFAALLTQWYRERNAGATPSPAMVKALMISGAVDMSGPAVIPNTSEGWGRLNLPNSIDNGKILIDQTVTLSDVGSTETRQYSAIDSAKPVRITLVWTDAPAAISANPALVNDLDLQVTAGANTYLGNVFSSGQSTLGGAPDRKNNIENVYLATGTTNFVVRIRAQSLPGDGVPNFGDTTDQDFALVCANCKIEPTFTLEPTFFLGGAFCRGDNTAGNINVNAISGFNDPVQLSVSGMPSGTQLALSGVTVNPNTSVYSRILVDNAFTGNYTASLIGTSGSIVRSLNIPLTIFGAAATAPLPQTPVNNATGVSTSNLSLIWNAGNADPGGFSITLSSSPSMNPIIHQADVTGTSYTLPASVVLNPNTSYFWRVQAFSACPDAFANKNFENQSSVATSQTFGFTTQ